MTKLERAALMILVEVSPTALVRDNRPTVHRDYLRDLAAAIESTYPGAVAAARRERGDKPLKMPRTSL